MQLNKELFTPILNYAKKKGYLVAGNITAILVGRAYENAVFASLLIALIFKTIGEQGSNIFGDWFVFDTLIELGQFSMKLVGPAIGVAVACGVQAPPLVLYTSVITGALGANVGGEAAALISALIGVEFGKMVSKETRVDILVTPGICLLTGAVAATFAGPVAKSMLQGIGMLIMQATYLQPFFMGIIVGLCVGIVKKIVWENKKSQTIFF